jgi:hypothetical protein
MFDDFYWVANHTDRQKGKYKKWLHNTVMEKNQKLVIIEIGCGTIIPTVRMNNEWTLAIHGDNTKLIRINPNDNYVEAGTGWAIRERALAALEQIFG